MGWPPIKPPPLSALVASGAISSNGAREFQAQMLTEHTFGSIECKGCGAAVHPHEHACSYCTIVPDREAQGYPEPVYGGIETTTMGDATRRFLMPDGSILEKPL
jgi:uncharacterized OB-fold protein